MLGSKGISGVVFVFECKALQNVGSSATNEQAVLDQKFARLKKWIVENGGFVHDALRLQRYEKPPFLFLFKSHPFKKKISRTIRTRFAIEWEDLEFPCIAIPSQIVVDRRRALTDLESIMTRAGCPPLYPRSTIEILTLFIAYHRRLGLSIDFDAF